MLNFVTLFDKNYLVRGLVLYNSLIEHSSDFVLYVLAMDTETERFLAKKKYPKLKTIALAQVESVYPELLKIKQERTRREYCWTLTPYCLQYVIKQCDLKSCTYIDADLCFYNDPQLILNELGGKSVLITEHRYTPEYDQTRTSGKYCVQFMYFKNDIAGQKVLEWWRQCCAEWCYARLEDGKFGDQKYLDDWISRFDCVCVPEHLGCGVAPWNVQQYVLTEENNVFYVQDEITKVKQLLTFYHFHGLAKCCVAGKIIWDFGAYWIAEEIKEVFYKSYISKLTNLENKIPAMFVSEPLRIKFPWNKKYSFLVFCLGRIKRVYEDYKTMKQQYFAEINRRFWLEEK
jgi:hypothetical protein